MKKYFILAIFVMLVLISGCITLTKDIEKISDLRDLNIRGEQGPNIKISGTIVSGDEANLCEDYLYLTDETGKIQVRDISNEYVGKNVLIKGQYFFPACEAICSCDPHIKVTYVEQESSEETEVDCTIPVDCEGRIHIQCVGYWQCIESKCNWQCTGEHLELPKNTAPS